MPGENNATATDTLMEIYSGANDTAPAEEVIENEEVVENAEADEAEVVVDEESEAVEVEAEAEAEEDPEGEAETEDPENELELSKEELATLAAHTREKINKRIGEFRSKLTDAEAEAASAKEQAEALESEAASLRAQVNSVGRDKVLGSLGVNPLLGTEDPAEIEKAEQFWRKAKRGLSRQVNANLGETDEGEIIAYRENGVDYTRDQVLDQLDRAEEMLEEVIPQARDLFAKRSKSSEGAKALYPELFKKGSPEAAIYQNALRMVPGLSVVPDAPLLIGAMLTGQKLFDPKLTELTVGGRTFVLKGSSKVKPSKTPPKVPSKPVPAGAKLVAKSQKGTGRFDQKAVLEADSPEEAALAQYRNIII